MRSKAREQVRARARAREQAQARARTHDCVRAKAQDCARAKEQQYVTAKEQEYVRTKEQECAKAREQVCIGAREEARIKAIDNRVQSTKEDTSPWSADEKMASCKPRDDKRQEPERPIKRTIQKAAVARVDKAPSKQGKACTKSTTKSGHPGGSGTP